MHLMSISGRIGLALAGLFAVTGGTAAQQQMPPAQVQVAVAEMRAMAPMMDVTGTVISLNDSRIAAEVEGVVQSVAQVGTHVAEGDVIATIDTRLLEIAHRRAVAALKRLEADMVFREQDVIRFEDLASRDNASKARLQEVISQRDMLVQNIEDARAQVDQTAGDLERAQIRAPFTGTVVARLVNKGEYLTVGREVARFVDTENIEVSLPAPIAIAPYLRAGEEVAVQSGERIAMLPIRTVVPVGDMVSRMVEVRLVANAADWTIGTPVTVSLPRAQAFESVAVPRDALVLKGGRTYVFKVSGDDTAEQVNASIRATVGLWVALSEGVDAGDRVVIRGAERLQPGQSVVIQERSR